MRALLLIFVSFFTILKFGHGQDSLLFFHGKKINAVEDWEKKKPEVKQLILKNIYGYMPPAPEWHAEVMKEIYLEDKNMFYKEVAIHLYKDKTPTQTIFLSLFIPGKGEKPNPVVLALNKCGNPTVLPIDEITVNKYRILHPWCTKQMMKRGGGEQGLRGMKTDFWAVDTLIRRGYAFATFHENDIATDVENLNQGIFRHYPELNNETGWKVISAWAWGLQRAVDYLVTDSLIDTNRIILFGHSRRGKAALLASALDERVAMVVPHQSGTGGMALGKKHPMESTRRINKAFPHWFSDRYKTFAKKPKTLPLDQHYLLALMAPRPVIETVGTYDPWSSYWLSLKNLKMVSPVYELYSKQGLLGKGKVKKREQFKTREIGRLVQVRRPYNHTMNGDYWSFILDFADLKLAPSN